MEILNLFIFFSSIVKNTYQILEQSAFCLAKHQEILIILKNTDYPLAKRGREQKILYTTNHLFNVLKEILILLELIFRWSFSLYKHTHTHTCMCVTTWRVLKTQTFLGYMNYYRLFVFFFFCVKKIFFFFFFFFLVNLFSLNSKLIHCHLNQIVHKCHVCIYYFRMFHSTVTISSHLYI